MAPTRRICLAVLALSLATDVRAAECGSITLHYVVRPPLIYLEGTQVQGLAASPAAWAFEAAEIPAVWVRTPLMRLFVVIEDNDGCDCTIGAFWTAERAKVGKFSAPVYQDNRRVALARADNAKLKDGMTVEAAFADKSLTFLTKAGYSYGQSLDKMIASLKPKLMTASVETSGLIAMIRGGRADYTLMTPEEAEALIASSGVPRAEFKLVTFANMVPGEKRYLYCSKRVGDEILGRFNDALTRYRP